MKLFETKPAYFGFMIGFILAMELLSWLTVCLLSPGWLSSILTTFFLASSQVTPAQPPKLSVRHGARHTQTLWTCLLKEQMNG